MKTILNTVYFFAILIFLSACNSDKQEDNTENKREETAFSLGVAFCLDDFSRKLDISNVETQYKTLKPMLEYDSLTNLYIMHGYIYTVIFYETDEIEFLKFHERSVNGDYKKQIHLLYLEYKKLYNKTTGVQNERIHLSDASFYKHRFGRQRITTESIFGRNG